MSAPVPVAPASFEELELLLDCAEREDGGARDVLLAGLDALAAAPAAQGLSAAARGARLLWRAALLAGAERLRAPASVATARLTRSFLDAERGAFRAAAGARVLPAEGNALAALAFAAAASAGETQAAASAASAVDFLRDRLFDPLLGLLSADEAESPEYGLLGDVAWSALAADALGRAEFARELGRVLVRELWDPARNGFAARIPRPGESTFALPDPGAEAAALEACWRLGLRRPYELGLVAARVRADACVDARTRAAVARAAAFGAASEGAR